MRPYISSSLTANDASSVDLVSPASAPSLPPLHDDATTIETATPRARQQALGHRENATAGNGKLAFPFYGSPSHIFRAWLLLQAGRKTRVPRLRKVCSACIWLQTGAEICNSIL